MILVSLLINTFVLAPICMGLLLNHPRIRPVFGEKTTAREILLSVYLTILIVSIGLLVVRHGSTDYVRTLLAVQISYKLISVILIKNKKTPVLWFNLGIAIFHSFTLATLF